MNHLIKELSDKLDAQQDEIKMLKKTIKCIQEHQLQNNANILGIKESMESDSNIPKVWT